MLERVGREKSWAVKAVKNEIRSRDGRLVSVDDAAKTGGWMLSAVLMQSPEALSLKSLLTFH